MWLDNASEEAVDRFWRQCGETEPFPRNLERFISLALPLTLIKLPHLRLHGIESWFEHRGASFRFNCRSRAVRGCLIAYGGQGLIFVEGADPDDERRFTIAHEVGHFLVDYLLVRETALAKFGEKIIQVFDGLRLPSVTERVHALLAGTSLGVYTNLMEREGASALARSEVWDIEDRADRVALALVAPPEEVLAATDTSAASFEQRQTIMIDSLRARFGLPEQVAVIYARSLLEDIGRGPSWAETLRPQ
jgi:IrrE N-terminal-like domain